MVSFLESDIEFLKGVGPLRGQALRKELGVATPRDLLLMYPFRYIDKTKFQTISSAHPDNDIVLLKGRIISLEKIRGKGNKARLSVIFKDESGFIELLWFQGIKWVEESLKENVDYVIFGRITVFGGRKSMSHPEYEEFNKDLEMHKFLEPVYSSTEKLDKLGLDSKGRRKLIKAILEKISVQDFGENLPAYIMEKLNFPSRFESIQWVHFPKDEAQKLLTHNRIKFEEFFFLQIKMLLHKNKRKQLLKGIVLSTIGENFNTFFKDIMPFELTNAQKRVIKEIRSDLRAGFQMNRLLQGDVGSGKTVVALMTMLIAIDNGFQACLMAPTEILASQHMKSIDSLLVGSGVKAAFLSGSIKGKKREAILNMLADGQIDILIGTHALIEDKVQFKNLGLSIIDEQHRFGVAQRSKLWKKNDTLAPHILVMTATPIPRTLAMSVYGDLDVSVIDELPPGRKEIKTIHKFENHRPQLIQFMHAEIEKGRQIYVVFPLIEESEKLDLQNLQLGYELLLPHFPPPKFQISVVHGRMKSQAKEFEMERFVQGKTNIMVATTVIEVGVNVPNASVMIIENSERFGLSQLHQLRGRVGRGAEQSYCILMSGNKLSAEAKERLKTMVATNNGFEIAEADLRLRGPGEIDGTRQSGIADFKLLNLVKDSQIITTARHFAEIIVEKDPGLDHLEHMRVKNYLILLDPKFKDWGRIS